MNNKYRSYLHLMCTRILPVLFAIHYSLFTFSTSPRVLPQKQAAHFCRLLVNEGNEKIYPLSVYAHRLTLLLCHDDRYGAYSAEQVFTGLVFFYDDWAQERLPFSNGQGRVLMEELHSGHTLRLFPHVKGKQATWYAPTDHLPASMNQEHQKYIHEVFSRLNALVQAGDWRSVDTIIDRMIHYQCQFGSQ